VHVVHVQHVASEAPVAAVLQESKMTSLVMPKWIGHDEAVLGRVDRALEDAVLSAETAAAITHESTIWATRRTNMSRTRLD